VSRGRETPKIERSNLSGAIENSSELTRKALDFIVTQ
jgi:hypothetical protein